MNPWKAVLISVAVASTSCQPNPPAECRCNCVVPAGGAAPSAVPEKTPPAKPEEVVPPPLELQLKLALAKEYAQIENWTAALESADSVVAERPKWPEPYLVRGGLYATLAGPGSELDALRSSLVVGPARLMRFTWTGPTTCRCSKVELKFVDAERYTMHCVDEEGMPLKGAGRWRLTGARLVLLAAEGETAFDGTFDGRVLAANCGQKSFPYTPKETGAVLDAGKALGHLKSAATDLQKYLELRPTAPNRDEVVRTLAQLRVRIQLVEKLANPTP